jgi:hypothetical protein
MNSSDDDEMKCGDEGACDYSSLRVNVELRLEAFDVLKET